MDQGPQLTFLSRRQVRRYVQHLSQLDVGIAKNLLAIREVYGDWPAVQAYAMAYYGALQTAEPLDLPWLRDKRS